MVPTAPNASTDTLAALAERHAAGVFRYLRSLVGDGEAARDLLQDTFLRLRDRAHEAGPGLVFTAARSCALDHLRRRKTRQLTETALDERVVAVVPARRSDRPDRQAEDAELRRDLLAALAALPEEQRSVFHLSEIEGLRYEEIATILGVSPGTIASRKHHAVRRLRDELRRRGHGT
jgi:RNA polymerase sigma-70 factor (ECF subfamily)